jgi:hypothetical protein
MPANRLPTVLLAIAFSIPVAGCVLDPASQPYQAYGSKGSYAIGFAYDGRGIVPFDGPVYLDVDERANTGRLIAKGAIGGVAFEVLMDEFAASKSFHDGGIARDLIEHGDSGVGDKTIPRVDLAMAGWGRARILYDGQPFPDPITGNETWIAHFMVLRTGVRDNATGAIYADANKTRTYDPNDPANATSSSDDAEIHLVLRNHTKSGSSEGAHSGTTSRTTTLADPDTSESRILFEADELGALGTLTFQVSDQVARGSNLTFTVSAPSGNVIAQATVGAATLQPGPASYTAVARFTVGELGAYVVAINGNLNAGGGYSVGYELRDPPALVLNLWWEDVVFGAAAKERASGEGLVATTPSAST